MLRNFNQRIAVAIAVMSVLLFSVGTCVFPAQRATHSCCSHMGTPAAPLKSSCCTAAPRVPPAVVTQAVRGIATAMLEEDYVFPDDGSVSGGVFLAAAMPAHSPPPGGFSLRI